MTCRVLAGSYNSIHMVDIYICSLKYIIPIIFDLVAVVQPPHRGELANCESQLCRLEHAVSPPQGAKPCLNVVNSYRRGGFPSRRRLPPVAGLRGVNYFQDYTLRYTIRKINVLNNVIE